MFVYREEEELWRFLLSMEVISAMENLRKKGFVSQLSVLDLLDLRVHLEEMGFLAEMDLQEHQEFLDLEVLQVSLEMMVNLECLEEMEKMVFLDPKDHQEKMDYLENLDLQVHQDYLALKDLQELLDPEEDLETRELMDLLDLLVLQDLLARMEVMDHQDLQDLLV